MIRNETEYQEAAKRLQAEKARLTDHEKRLKAEGHSASEVKHLMDPLRSFHLQLEEEVAHYERLKRGDFDELLNLKGLGRLLTGLRIARGYTQKELAERLGVHESQISRDERNEYHGITVERASKILEALGTVLVTSYEPTRSQPEQTKPKSVARRPALQRVRTSRDVKGAKSRSKHERRG